MSRTNIDIDEDTCRVVMQRYRFSTKREAVKSLCGPSPASLIGATAIRASVPVLHSDCDFEVLARHTALAIDGERAEN
jgi:predicted nucleic acid-binding protein